MQTANELNQTIKPRLEKSLMKALVYGGPGKIELKEIPVPVKPSPDSVFGNLKWRIIGPFRGGRANAVSGVINNDQKFYAGYTGGGVWATEDGGNSWKNISDGFI